MERYVAILRGINVGGKRKILMADLKQLFEKLGLRDVATYIQSGNVIFDSDEEKEIDVLVNTIEKSLFSIYGFAVPVIIRTVAEFNKTINNNPFLKRGIGVDNLHLTLLKESPDNEKLEKIRQYNFEPDMFEIRGKDVFVMCSGKYGDSKLSNTFFESKLGIIATTRNWNTILKISEIAATKQ